MILGELSVTCAVAVINIVIVITIIIFVIKKLSPCQPRKHTGSGTRWNSEVWFMTRLLYFWGKPPLHPLNWRLGGSPKRSE